MRLQVKTRVIIAAIAITIIAITIISVTAVLFLLSHGEYSKSESGEMPVGTVLKLSEPVTIGNMSVEEAISRRRSVRSYSSEKIKESDISQLLWAAQGITDKENGLRAAPSAGALYPLEIYIAIAMVEGIEEGLYKYDPLKHSLILKKTGDIRERIYKAGLRQDSIKNAAAVIVYCAVFERTASRYKDRAPQYVYIETGHSAQNVYLQAEALGLGTVAIGAFDDAELRKALGPDDNEKPVYIMPVGRKN